MQTMTGYGAASSYDTPCRLRLALRCVELDVDVDVDVNIDENLMTARIINNKLIFIIIIIFNTAPILIDYYI